MTVPAVSAASDDAAEASTWGSATSIALLWGLVLLLAVAPLPLAAVNAPSWTVLAIASGVLVALAAVAELGNPSEGERLRSLRIPIILAIVVAVWILLQQFALTLPDWNAAAWDRAERALGEPVTRSISIARERSLGHLLRLLGYGAVFLVAWNVCRRSGAATIVLRAVAFLGAAYALYGLIVFFSGNHTVLWYRKSFYGPDLTGSFVNRNAFAAFLGLCLLANLGVLARVFMERVDASSWRTLLHSSIEAALKHGLLAMLSLALTASALLLTHSRGAMIATLVGATALIAAAFYAPSLRGPWRWPLAALAGAGAMIMIAVAGSTVLERIGDSTDDVGARGAIYAGTTAAIGDHPILGTGLGSFEYVFAGYQAQSELKLVEYAHNEYLQTMLELGIPAALLFFAILATLAGRCLRGVVRRRRNAIFPCVGVGAVVLSGVHSAVDFSLELPAVATVFAALLGMAVAQSLRSNANGSGAPYR